MSQSQEQIARIYEDEGHGVSGNQEGLAQWSAQCMAQDTTMSFTISRGRQGAVGIVMIPQRRRVKGILDIVHELDHLIYIMTRLRDDKTSN
jgi:hypothetical protein